jgi:hypothetical protein
MTADELETQLQYMLASKTTMTPEDIRIWEALRAKAAKVSCSTEADKLKRQRDDEDKDPNSQAKKHKHAEGPSSQPQQPVNPSTTTTSTQPPKASGSGHKAHDHFVYTGGDEIPQPDEVPEPASTKKKQRKGKQPKNKSDTSSKSQESMKADDVLHWLDEDQTKDYTWFDKMVNSQPPLAEDQEPLDGRTVEYAQLFQRKFHMKKMNKKELRRIKNTAFNLLRDRSANSIELEYHLENIVRAMSSNIDWINPESRVDPVTKKSAPYITDWSKPLPLIGKPKEPKIPFIYFFNTDLEFLQHGNAFENRYATSITKIPAAWYLNNAIEEDATRLFVDKQVPYDKNALFGIHNWPDNRAQYYRSSRLNQTMGEVMSDLKIVSVQSISTLPFFGYPYLSNLILKRLDEKEYEISEADFPRLHLNDIEDLYLLKVQGKLCNLPKEKQLALMTALLIYMRHIIIRERVEDLQLGVESYQKKLNLTKPNLYDIPELQYLPQYTLIRHPAFGFSYRSINGRNCFMGYEEIHKFCDETLKFVRDGIKSRLDDITLGKSKRWNTDEAREARRFITRIEHRLRRRDQFRRLESYVGGRPGFPVLTFQRPDW